MTTPNGSNTPSTEPAPSDDELEARLRGSWDRNVAKAEDDLARTDLVAVALAGGRRRSPWRSAGGAVLGVAAVLLVGAALIVGGGGLRDAREPLASPRAIASIGAAISPAPTPHESVPSGPDGSVAPVEMPTGGIPYDDPATPFPATVDGRPVVAVGNGAEEALAAATDASPIFVSGWMIGPDRRGCADFDGSPAPTGVRWKDCSALVLRATADGGATLRVYLDYERLTPESMLRGPTATMAMEVLLRVHAHDPGCDAADCAHKPVYDAVVEYRNPRIAPSVLANTMPPGVITMAEAIAAADAYVADPQTVGASWILLRAELGPSLVVGENGGGDDGRWVWAIWYVSADGYFETTVYVDALDGSANHSSGGNVTNP